MELKVLATPYDEFWEQQNQKLLANDFFVKEKGTLFDDVLNFKHHGASEAVTKLDFSIFDLPIAKLDGVAILHIEGKSYPLSAKEYAKLFICNAITLNNSRDSSSAYQFITHIFGFLKAQGFVALNSKNFEAFWISFLIESVNKNGLHNRVSPLSYKGSIGRISLPKLRNKLKGLGVKGVIDNMVTPKIVNASLKEACQSQLGITLEEYKKGGSYNALGLELGQYYIDYLRQVYQDDYLYMVVCKNAINEVFTKYNISNLMGRDRLSSVVFNALTNIDTSEKINKHTRKILHKDLFFEVQEAAFAHYEEQFDIAMSLNEKNIERLVVRLGLEMRFDAVEVIRILMLQEFYDLQGHKSPEEVWNGYLSSLDKTFLDNKKLSTMEVSYVYEQMQIIIRDKKLNKETFLNALTHFGRKLRNRGKNDDYQSFKAELNTIVNAMTTLVVSWLGYRKSEFGFPLSAIHTEPNLDIFDNSHVPFRFKLKWVVPKTNKTTKIDREITSQCYQVAVQLNDLFCAEGIDPCLYQGTSGNKKSNKSGVFIEGRVKANWKNFVRGYQPFVEVLQLESLIKKGSNSLSEKEQQDLEQLRHVYDINTARYKHLLSTAHEVNRDWLRLSCTPFNGTHDQIAFKKSLESIVLTGKALSSLHQEVIDTYLSDETKNLLRSGTVDLDVKSMMDISEELLRGVRYPSPHAFRHVWAEAVLTRYQGNVGAVIRHQFCHLDDSFFMAYLRDKDARGLMKGARQRYLNSIVDLLMLDSDKVGKEYIGGFARYVKKATELTKPVSESEIRALRESINGRIISIQPSHFAICVPRDGGEKRAKCAKFGSINPQDAKPDFCLNCTNALIMSGNVRGIWTTIQPMVKEALNENTMGFMLEGHLSTLRSGYKRIKELQPSSPNKEAITKILNAIEEAISCIELKLKEEELMYV